MKDIVERLRAAEVWHTQVSEPYEPYETVARVRPIEAIKLEAAGEIERLRLAVAAERERCADVVAGIAYLMETGAGECAPGERLRQAERMIFDPPSRYDFFTTDMRGDRPLLGRR